jgi:hypothetical protein
MTLPQCPGNHTIAVCGNSQCKGRTKCVASCKGCPGLGNASVHPLCTGTHEFEGPKSCNNPVCGSKQKCVSTCKSCPDAFRPCAEEGCTNKIPRIDKFCIEHGGRARDDNPYCDGAHTVAGGCGNLQCKGRKYCHSTCETCPAMLLAMKD